MTVAARPRSPAAYDGLLFISTDTSLELMLSEEHKTIITRLPAPAFVLLGLYISRAVPEIPQPILYSIDQLPVRLFIRIPQAIDTPDKHELILQAIANFCDYVGSNAT